MAYKVLLVDDDANVLQTLALIFKTKDYEVTPVCSANEAITALAAEAFDLVVTDMRMETTTAGYDVVRAAAERPNRPVIAICSAYPLAPAKCKDMGADAVYQKGGGLIRMLDDLDVLLRNRTPGVTVDPRSRE